MTSASQMPTTRREPTADEFVAMQQSSEFGELRSAYRNFTFPCTVAFLTWFLLYVVCAMFAPDLMAIELAGGWNLGLVWGLLQFASTFIITWAYVKYANKNIEPKAAAIREEMEG